MRNQQISRPQATSEDRRFDALVKRQEGEHQHIISSHNKEMQSLRDEIRLVLQRCESLSERVAGDLNAFKADTSVYTDLLHAKIKDHETIIADQRKAINSLHDQLNAFCESKVSNADMDKFKKETDGIVANSVMNNIISFQNCQRESKVFFNALKDDFVKSRSDIEKKISDAVEKGENNFSQARLDKEGIEREFIRYKKSMLYIEKKIENIYTLIERINKIGGICHKPE